MSHLSPNSVAGLVVALVFTVILVLACISDVRTRRIPNRLVLLLAVGGLAHSLVREPAAAAVLPALAAMALGFVIWLPFHLMRMLGAGDVKLFAAASTWLVPVAVLNASLIAALAGGVLSLFWMVRSYGGSTTFFMVRRLASVSGIRDQVVTAREGKGAAERPRGEARVPYGIAMAIGLLATIWLPYHLL